MTISWEIPIRTVSESNCSQHWSKKHKRHQQQQFFVKMALGTTPQKIGLPCSIKVVRIANRKLDYDNLVSSQKWVVDAICDCITPGLKPGRADGDDRISVSYSQEKGNRQGVRIEITPQKLDTPSV